MRLDVHIVGVLRDPLHLSEDLKTLCSKHDLVEAAVLILPTVEAKSDGGHVKVSQESHTAEELILGFRSGDEADQVWRTVGSQYVGDVVVIAGEVD